MELPQIGSFCTICGSLDFVAFICPHCRAHLCGEHASMPSHNCPGCASDSIDVRDHQKVSLRTQISFCRDDIDRKGLNFQLEKN